MPSAWLNKIMERHENPCEILSIMKQGADVSFEAALIRLLSALMPGYLYALVNEEGFVVSSDRSQGTLVRRFRAGFVYRPRNPISRQRCPVVNAVSWRISYPEAFPPRASITKPG